MSKLLRWRSALENRCIRQKECEADHEDGGDPGDDIEGQSVDVVAHQITAVHKQEDENDDDGKPDAVADLRKDKDFPKWRMREQYHSRADQNKNGVQAIKNAGVFKFMIDSGFKAEAFADHVRG